MKMILASSSVFRKELMEKLKIDFSCEDSKIDEESFKDQNLSPTELAKTLAFEKANSLAHKYPEAIIIGSDQVCFCDDQIFGKPVTFEKAKEQLGFLNGKTHYLYTAYCLLYRQKKIIHCNTTTLQMKHLSTTQIENYIRKDEPFYCAGSYKIESLGIALFDRVETSDWSAIIGLPMQNLIKDLTELGVTII